MPIFYQKRLISQKHDALILFFEIFNERPPTIMQNNW